LPTVGSVEAGGTKILCAVGSTPEEILEGRVISIPTDVGPDAAVAEIAEFFGGFSLDAIGVASFGPLDLATGTILSSPKTAWVGVHWRQVLHRYLPEVPVAVDTDVNGAVLAEAMFGSGRDMDVVVYLTVGTGIGGGVLINGEPLHGLQHPEIGHLWLPKVAGDQFEGSCPFHGTCWEGLASGSAIEARWGVRGEMLPANHEAWELESHYLALGLVNLVVTLSPERIVIGGGVMKQTQLIEAVRGELVELIGGYPVTGSSGPLDADHFLVPPTLGDRAGVVGAMIIGGAAVVGSVEAWRDALG
jgi:fructokinase